MVGVGVVLREKHHEPGLPRHLVGLVVELVAV